jgi:hypothetical protein
MSEPVFWSTKTQRQIAPEPPTRRLRGNPVQPKAESALARQAADIGSIQIHPRGQTVPQSVHDELRSPGTPLDRATLQRMEPHFGELRDVRVHTGALAAASADAIGAAAYTYRNDVVFAAGQFGLDTQARHDLLAHELVHVVQQRGVSASGVAEITSSDHPLERNARSVLTGGAAPAAAPRAMLQRQGANDPLSPVSLSKPNPRLGTPRTRPSVMSGQLGFHLLASDRQTLSDFLTSGNLEVGPDLTPIFQGTPMSLDAVTDLARKLVLPIVPREEVSEFVRGKFLSVLVRVKELPPLPTMHFRLPPEGGQTPAPGPPGAAGGQSADASEWQAAVGGQWTYHLNNHGGPQTSNSVQVQFQHGSGALVEVFQYQVDLNTRVAQPMGGLQLQYSKAGKVLGVALQGTAFLQLMAGLTQAPGSLSGDITFQIQGGLQGTATFGKISVALQLGLSVTFQGTQKPAWDTNVAPQAGNPDTFGMIDTPGGGQVAGLTLRF